MKLMISLFLAMFALSILNIVLCVASWPQDSNTPLAAKIFIVVGWAISALIFAALAGALFFSPERGHP